MTTHDLNCEVMVKPQNESGRVRENLQNDRLRVFRDTPDCLHILIPSKCHLKLFSVTFTGK